jgi:hypothetical protein
MLHLLCIGFATTSVAGGATLSYNQLAGADLASPVSGPAFDSILGLARRLSSRPLGSCQGVLRTSPERRSI